MINEKDLESKKFIKQGFRTFKQDDAYTLVSKILVELDHETGNYFIELFGKEENYEGNGFDEYIIDAKEVTNMEGVKDYLTFMGRNTDEVLKILKEESITDEG